jgi:hypothetical protein
MTKTGRRGSRGLKRDRAKARHDHDGQGGPRGNRKDRRLSIEFPDQTKRNFCRLGRLKARPEQSLPHCYRDAHRPRWRYSTTRAPEGSTRATACPSAQRSTPQRTPLVHLVLTYLTHTLRPVLTASYNAVPHPRPHHPKPLLFAGIGARSQHAHKTARTARRPAAAAVGGGEARCGAAKLGARGEACACNHPTKVTATAAPPVLRCETSGAQPVRSGPAARRLRAHDCSWLGCPANCASKLLPSTPAVCI